MRQQNGGHKRDQQQSDDTTVFLKDASQSASHSVGQLWAKGISEDSHAVGNLPDLHPRDRIVQIGADEDTGKRRHRWLGLYAIAVGSDTDIGDHPSAASRVGRQEAAVKASI
jgi:hypothetical protein